MYSIYIHIPFCDSKCGYCGFYSTVNKNCRKAYLESVLSEARSRVECVASWGELSTIYIGGGSPSVFSAEQWSDFFKELSKIFPVEQAKEITLEVNPEHISSSYMRTIAEQTPVTRISMGVQSFDDNDLLFLGRKHSRKEIFNAISSVVGLLELSIDLIYGISDVSWLKNLEELKQLDINHFSAYSLTIEPNTVFSKKNFLENDVLAEKNYFELQQWCKENNFEKYETSNYARDKKYSLHNCHYWQLVPYLGLGAGAHSYSGFWGVGDSGTVEAAECGRRGMGYGADGGSGTVEYGERGVVATVDVGDAGIAAVRKWNTCNAENYILEEEFLSWQDTLSEYAMIALRTKWGMQKSILEKFLPDVRQKAERVLSQEKSKGNIIETETSFLLSEQAELFADKVASEFF